MNRSTILALLMLVSSVYLFSGCVVPADGYHSDPYDRPGMEVVPALPYTVTLYGQPYYNYHGYYYFYNNQRWYYSRAKGVDWIALPRTHWPFDTKWKGHHLHNDHRDHTYDKPDSRPPKDPKYRPQENPRWDDKNKQKNNPFRKDSRHDEKNHPPKYPHNKDLRQGEPHRLQKDQTPKDGRRDERDQRRPSPGKQPVDPRQHDSGQRMHSPQNKKDQDAPKRTEEETRPNEHEFKRR